MWPRDYSARLQAWADLRDQCSQLPLAQALDHADAWWQQTPWKPYYLHWDDRNHWPTPWELLSDNVYCDLARAVGIMYTVTMLERDDITEVELADTDQGNLVLVIDDTNTSTKKKRQQRISRHRKTASGGFLGNRRHNWCKCQ